MVKRIIGVPLRVVVVLMVAIIVGQDLFNGSLFPAAGTSHIKQQEVDTENSHVGTGRHLNTGNQTTSIATLSLGFNASNSSLTGSKLSAEESITGSSLQADGVKTPEEQGSTNEPTSSDILNASDTASIEAQSKEGIPVVPLNATGNLSLTLSASDVISLNETQDNNDKLPACQIRVFNLDGYHYEVIESVAKLIPFEYLNLPDTCNHQHLHFHFHAVEGKAIRAVAWFKYMNERVFNTTKVDETTGITRYFGSATWKPSSNAMLFDTTTWDTSINISCHCHRWGREWMQNSTLGPRVCILHGKCGKMDNLPNSVQVSPHHKRYFIPSILPDYGIEFARRKGDKKLEICSIGGVSRRNWKFLVPFFKDASNEKYFDKIRLRMLGRGGVPKELKAFTNRTEISPEVITDDRVYYATAKFCNIIILTVNFDIGRNYFKSMPGSEWKLSGSIPPIIAFKRPFVIPEELVELYKADLPMQAPHRGYNHKNFTSFSEALGSLLEEIVGKESGS